MEERLQKLIASAGLCSRRAAEKLLTDGVVTVNGRVAALGEKADPAKDSIAVNGNLLTWSQPLVYLMLNKPVGYVTTLSDEKGRPTVADLTKDVGTRVFPVGRLDLMSEGLLLMTNDGELMQQLIHPSYEVTKTYHLTVSGRRLEGAAERLSTVRDLDGETIRPAEVQLLRRSAQTAELSVTIHEGKNRQIRRMCEACDLSVRKLRRVQEHTLKLGNLPAGAWRYLTEEEISALKSGV